MCSRILGLSSFSRMSESDSSKFSPDEKEEKQKQIQEKLATENPDLGREIASGIDDGARETTPGNGVGEVKVGSKELVELISEDVNVATAPTSNTVSEDGGFITPTSSDHRIPAITQCPPAPRKTGPQSVGVRRKMSPSRARRSLQFEEAADEVESIFRPADTDQDSVKEKKTKKARTDHADEE